MARYGANTLPSPPKRSAVLRFLMQFHNVLIYVLLGAAAVTALLGHWVDTGVIIGVVLINAVIGHIQEGKAEQALDAIRRMLSLHAQVLRDGRRKEILAESLVPGDIVFVASGDKVPADLRLLEVRSLRIGEAVLTGESMAVEKRVEPVSEDCELGDRFSIAYSGTLVTYGQGTGVVIATGAATEIGRISAMLGQMEGLTTPLLKKLTQFGRWLTWVILVASCLLFAFGTLAGGYSMREMFLAAVGLAVAAIPEGLPAIMTITLALGVQRMARRKAIIRRLPAVEALGSVTVICSDKTGTLTRNEMTVQQVITADAVFDVSGIGYDPRGDFTLDGGEIDEAQYQALKDVGRAVLLCNDASLRKEDGQWQLAGDPTEGALLTLALKAGLDQDFEKEARPRTDAIPFESEHRFMASLHHDHEGHHTVFLKGAPERVLELCRAQREEGKDRPLEFSRWHESMEIAAGSGMRLLAVAMRTEENARLELDFFDVEAGDFTLLAVVAITDPPRDEAIRAVAACRAAGIRVKMITGDHVATASAIGQRLALAARIRTVTGASLDAMDDTQLQELVAETEVFARASPEHKLRLVKALQARGEVVAMTGDGVNDAPALKRADVGVAMGCKGTEAAKEAAEIVLADDNFASIVAAVEEGRTAYDNIRKAFTFILPTNGGEAGMVLIAILLGINLPITPVQILWVNMVTAVTLSLAIAFEQGEADIMRRPPRDPKEPLLSRFLIWRIVLVSVLLVAGSLGLFLWELDHGKDLATARTVAVNALVMGEITYLFNCRHMTASALNREGMLGNRFVLLAIGLLLVFQMLFTYLPVMQAMFGTAGLDLASWGRVVLFGLALMLIVEAEKFFLRRAALAPTPQRA
ncbi:MAG: carbonate dehydratase [Burkholderiales bacterium RIFCSPLOWO2_02_FULL_57_36]|nr:MAG: carbonate dehydratase [Burkholderiales bacterium RIFCSPLOWO2_02_FULL_57_36]